MASTIRALEGRTVHQIQSGQIIVDLCSVVKELVENSLDAGATSIEVRLRNNGLDSIEVQDNGVGITRENYESIALKHCTSKLSSYDDLSSLQTFGFRGEALSSLCALAKFYITTARADEAPKGTRLDFDISGKLQGTRVAASQRGTTVVVEDIFRNLPVRRRELEKNIKREYGKALGILQAYACISTQARISVSNMMAKGKKVIAFATRSSPTTKENIANVFGAKVLPGLITMDLSFNMRPSTTISQLSDPQDKQVRMIGHISRPTIGEGKQAPDRQMFFVNARPCALPQVAKVFNEVYKSYNMSQSPFVFSNIVLDANAYDVNVSPDKRTILLHEQSALLESLRTSLTELFDKQDQCIPMSQRADQKLPSYKQPILNRVFPNRQESDSGETEMRSVTKSPLPGTKSDDTNEAEDQATAENPTTNGLSRKPSLIENFVGRDSKKRLNGPELAAPANMSTKGLSRDKQKLIRRLGRKGSIDQLDDDDGTREPLGFNLNGRAHLMAVDDFNERIAEQQLMTAAEPAALSVGAPEGSQSSDKQSAEPPTSSVVQDAFHRIRSQRDLPEVATISIGAKTTTSLLGSASPRQVKTKPTPPVTRTPKHQTDDASRNKFSSSMRSFAAPDSELIQTVGRPQSKPCISRDYSSGSFDGEVLAEDRSAQSVASDEEDHEVVAGEALSDIDNELSSNESHDRLPWDSEADGEYLEEEEKKAREDAKIAKMIRQAEENAAIPSQDSRKRARELLKGAGQRDSVAHLIQVIDAAVERIDLQLSTLLEATQKSYHASRSLTSGMSDAGDDASPDERLSLTVSKTDFANMHISGQFNQGFILATRENVDLLIIDQHASDEKYNFERLRANTVVQNQLLVQPRKLQLTAVEEEIILERKEDLLKNGFMVDVDDSGELPVGQRCKLISLPMSREVTFDITDLEELIVLLADSPTTTSITNVPRPSKVRRMFAMRACRSSIMVGKTLTLKQMRSLVSKMGQIDKPWNCPHGRPTMRHVCKLDGLYAWQEGDGLAGLEEEREVIHWGRWHTHMMEGQAETSEEFQDEAGQMSEDFEADEEEAETPDE